MKRLNFMKKKNGEGYIDVAVTIMIISFVLVFMLNIVSLMALNQNLKAATDLIVEYASMNGTVNIDDYVEEQREKLGVDFACSFAGTQTINSSGKVQLGNRIFCNVTYSLRILGVGGERHAITITASATGLSQIYWK